MKLENLLNEITTSGAVAGVNQNLFGSGLVTRTGPLSPPEKKTQHGPLKLKRRSTIKKKKRKKRKNKIQENKEDQLEQLAIKLSDIDSELNDISETISELELEISNSKTIDQEEMPKSAILDHEMNAEHLIDMRNEIIDKIKELSKSIDSSKTRYINQHIGYIEKYEDFEDWKRNN